MTNYPAVQTVKTHLIATHGQYHGCPECGEITWHRREQCDGVTVLVCVECEAREEEEK